MIIKILFYWQNNRQIGDEIEGSYPETDLHIWELDRGEKTYLGKRWIIQM